MSRYSVAKELANELNTKWEIDWITPWMVQIFIVLSLPVRRFLLGYIRLQRGLLLVKKQDYVLQAQKGDGLAEQLFGLRLAANAAAQPVTDLLRVLPLDTILKEIPEVELFAGGMSSDIADWSKLTVNNALDYLTKLSPDLALFITETVDIIPISVSSNFEGFDMFEGVDSFKDLKDKIDELIFRTARATALSTYANAGSAYVDNLLRKLDIYIDILETLDVRNL